MTVRSGASITLIVARGVLCSYRRRILLLLKPLDTFFYARKSDEDRPVLWSRQLASPKAVFSNY
jgi:hypothetical protein